MEDPDYAVKVAHAALYRDQDPRAFGGGVLIAPDLVLTCAHVVNQILGRPSLAQERPAGPDDVLATLSVALPGAFAKHRFRAKLEGWLPAGRPDGQPARDGDAEWAGDLALLRIEDAPACSEDQSLSVLSATRLPDVRPPDIGRCRVGTVSYVWFGSGAPSTIAAAMAQGVTDHWIVLDCPASAQGIVGGYSGSPLWDRELQQVVGLVVGRRGQRAFAVPVWDVHTRFEAGGDGTWPASARPARDDRRRTSLILQLLGPLRACLVSAADRAECADRLVRELGLPGQGPGADASHEWIARMALSRPRGIPTLLALVHSRTVSEDDRRWVRRTALSTAPDQFLTALEHRELLELLIGKGPDSASVPGPQDAAARALRLGPSLTGLEWPEAVAVLEAYQSRRGRVPRLLRLVEFAAAHTTAEETQHALRAWNDAVARRLDVSESLLEHRAQAIESLDAAIDAPVVQVQLWRAGNSDAFSYVLRATDALGGVTHHRTQDRPVPLTGLLAELRTVLEDIAPHSAPGALPTVECFVTPDELDLPFDQWIYHEDDLFPAVLGKDFLCVLRCPELRRRTFASELRYRWQALLSGRLVLLERHDPVIQKRGAASPVCAVALISPDTELVRLRVIALAVGVPGVVWARPSTRTELGQALIELAQGAAPHELPRRVYEARVAAEPGSIGTRLALVWDGPDNLPEALRLSDPSP
ncbi:VMAP-C domain-containing protein [Streptomyces coeruleorubidus]|uniref:VMAP-C domain-containing protein n=1 Tax=Streptomyces coeruleorubidus TaxID=116188 RepID=UPI003655083F